MHALKSSCLICWLALLTAATGLATPAPPVATPPRIRVVTDNNYPPYLFLDADGKPEGYEADIWRLFEAHTGIQVDLEPMSWAAAQQTLLAGKADVIDMIYQTSARESLYDFSPPYGSHSVAIYVDRSIHGVHDLASLRGLSVGVERGDACAEKLASQGIVNLRQFDNYRDIIDAATNGNLRVFCMDEDPADYYLYRHAAVDRFHNAFVLYTGQLRLAVRKGDVALLQTVELGMAEITPSERASLRKRWLDQPVALWPYLRMAKIALAAALVFAALVALWVWLLHRTVARRTRELRAQESKLRALFDASPDAMTVKDGKGVYVDCNDSAIKRLGFKRDKIIGHTTLDVFGAAIGSQMQALDEEVKRLGHPRIFSDPYFPWNDGPRVHEMVKVPLRAPDGIVDGVLTIARDITERKHAENELRLAAAAFETQEAMMVTDAEVVIQRVNDAMLRLTGYTAAELVGQPTTLLRSRQHDDAFYQQVRKHIRTTGLWQGDQWLQGKHGEPKAVRMLISRVANANGDVTHYICSMIDLTSERTARASIDHMTFFDPLTDLPNRYFLHGRLQHLLDATDDPNGGALLMIDLDHFKRVNDLRGHAAGDRLLSLVAQRLRALLDDRCVLCRFSGGTFALLEACHPDNPGPASEQARVCAERVRRALLDPFEVGGELPVALTVSIGWTRLLPGQGTPDSVLKEAELAMYGAKAAGRDQVRRFEPAMQVELVRRESLIHDLRSAIADDALALHLQALVDRGGHITGAEMLLRWTRPCGEAVSPAVFIPLAEESGLILSLGNWVLDHACAQLAAWSANPSTHGLSLAINVSARQFAEAEFVDRIQQALAATGAAPARLKLEITETAILGDLAEIGEKVSLLRAHGISVSLDDFGTGYSSLNYLSYLQLDQIKIDQSFVARLPGDANGAMVAQTIVAMGHGLGMEVVAEGVETEAQLDFLMAQGCDVFQGYLFARPMPVAAFERMLEERALPVQAAATRQSP